MQESDFAAYLTEARSWVVRVIEDWVSEKQRYRRELYDLVLDYPLREAKGLRPALAIASCRALGGTIEGIVPTAAALELYHNAFLVHDDVEDASELRRGARTLQEAHGVPIAVNVGDAMLALTLRPLLENTGRIGLGRALRIFDEVSAMAQSSAEGQALELHWIREGRLDLDDSDYLQMVELKTAHYSFVTPIAVGAIAAGSSDERVCALKRFARSLGVAFQIQDDILNLTAEPEEYGKERLGDLWEGKYTLILIHALRSATAAEREHMARILTKPRPKPGLLDADVKIVERGLLAAPADEPDVVAARAALARLRAGVTSKTQEDVDSLLASVQEHRSLAHARQIARGFAQTAKRQLTSFDAWLPRSIHRDFLHWVVDFVIERER